MTAHDTDPWAHLDEVSAPVGPPAPVMVHYGPADHQVVSLPLAEALLCRWRAKAPSVFGRTLAEVITEDISKDK